MLYLYIALLRIRIIVLSLFSTFILLFGGFIMTNLTASEIYKKNTDKIEREIKAYNLAEEKRAEKMLKKIDEEIKAHEKFLKSKIF